ncbi:hypothetical protein [Flammeovirga sp. SJP92]|uniref:hypothetical protein n=1 Tax=Flammeovirga sp. SJP92 TaxID=1775430 RepID=UPI0012F79F3D|nr:hypothetical protein [Flammeovirga sp. SJP92]
MKSKILKISLFLFLLGSFQNAMFAQEKEGIVEKVRAFVPSYVGENDKDAYQLQAINHHKLWFFILDDKKSLHVLTFENDSLQKTSEFFEMGLFKIVDKYGMSCENKIAPVNDLTLKPYYKFKKKASKDFERLLYLEYGYVKNSFFRKVGNVIIFPFTFFLSNESSYDKAIKKMQKVEKNIQKQQNAYQSIASPLL